VGHAAQIGHIDARLAISLLALVVRKDITDRHSGGFQRKMGPVSRKKAPKIHPIGTVIRGLPQDMYVIGMTTRERRDVRRGVADHVVMLPHPHP